MFTNEQMKAIQWFNGPMLVLGTPGSGKTTVITNRVNNLIYEYNVRPENILVITFTKAAADSMQRRFLDMSGLERTTVRFGTFHSFFYWIIRTAYKKNFTVLDETVKKEAIRNIIRNEDNTYDNDEMVQSVINQISRLSSDMIDIENYYSRDLPDEVFKKVYSKYGEYKSAHVCLDFDDMVTECYRLLSARSDILDSIRNMYKYIMVDEFQDTNRIQYEILRLLAHPRDNVFVVGDDDQSIYGFRGAKPDIMLRFPDEFKGTEIIQLSSNFRCPQEIVSLSKTIIDANKNRYKKTLVSEVNEEGKAYVIKVPDEKAQTASIVSRIISAHEKGLAYDEIAVLYRTNMRPGRLINELGRYNIPFCVKDKMPDIFSSFSVKPVIAYISFALGENTRQNFLAFMNKPVRYISRDMLKGNEIDLEMLLKASEAKDYLYKNIKRLMAELGTISRLKPFSAVNYIRQAVGYEDYLKKLAEERNIDYDSLSEQLDEFQDLIRDAEDYDEMFEIIRKTRLLYEKLASESEMKKKNAVQLMTLHSAKGLEFRNVHIMDVVEGIIPHKKSKAESEVEEERRMFYVGVTRSSSMLYMYVPNEIGERKSIQSRFLDSWRI